MVLKPVRHPQDPTGQGARVCHRSLQASPGRVGQSHDPDRTRWHLDGLHDPEQLVFSFSVEPRGALAVHESASRQGDFPERRPSPASPLNRASIISAYELPQTQQRMSPLIRTQSTRMKAVPRSIMQAEHPRPEELIDSVISAPLDRAYMRLVLLPSLRTPATNHRTRFADAQHFHYSAQFVIADR